MVQQYKQHSFFVNLTPVCFDDVCFWWRLFLMTFVFDDVYSYLPTEYVLHSSSGVASEAGARPQHRHSLVTVLWLNESKRSNVAMHSEKHWDNVLLHSETLWQELTDTFLSLVDRLRIIKFWVIFRPSLTSLPKTMIIQNANRKSEKIIENRLNNMVQIVL